MVVEVNIKDEKAELFLSLLNELKNGVVEKFQVLKDDYIEQKEIEEIYKNMSKEDKEVAFSKIVKIEI